MLFAGDKCHANIKFKDHQIVHRTPILVTCNSDPFPHNSAINVRMQRYRWNSYNLNNDNKKLYPLALFELFAELQLLK